MVFQKAFILDILTDILQCSYDRLKLLSCLFQLPYKIRNILTDIFQRSSNGIYIFTDTSLCYNRLDILKDAFQRSSVSSARQLAVIII